MVQSLKVILWGEEIGRLAWDTRHRLSCFMYNPAFLKKGLNISPLAAPVDGARGLTPVWGEEAKIYQKNPDEFYIPSDVAVVGVENGENFCRIRSQKYQFGDNKVLFVSRYLQSADLREWLIKIPNRYIHFGDFDLAGICIYQSEFYKFLGDRASFLIPEDIEERLKSGNTGLYDTQYLRYKNLKIIDSRLNGLVGMIHHYGRVYEQEGYIEKCAY